MTDIYLPKKGDRVRVLERHESDAHKDWCAPGATFELAVDSVCCSQPGYVVVWHALSSLGAYCRVEPVAADQPAKAWEPKVGEMCEGTVIANSNLVPERGKRVRGRFVEHMRATGNSGIALMDGSRRYVTSSSLRPVAAHPEPVRVGDKVRGKWLGDASKVFTGVVLELDSMSEVFGKRGVCITPDDGSSFTSVTLDPATVEKLDSGTASDDTWVCLGCGATCGADPTQCGLCGVVRGHKSRAKPVEPARVDPYAEHRAKNDDASVAMTMLIDDAFNGRSHRLRQALDQLGNNTHALRVSRHSAAMDVRATPKNRGKYGEPVSAFPYEEKWESAGWDSD
jgi:hypothetical protein